MTTSSSEIPTGLKATLNLITGGVSVAAGLWIFHFYSKTPHPRSVSLKLILWLSIADFIYSIANIMSAFDTDSGAAVLCNIEARLRLFSVMSGLYWSSCIAILTYESFSKGSNFPQDQFFRKALLVGLIVPILITLIPDMSTEYAYGPQKFGCYVTVEGENTKLKDLVLIILFDGIPVMSALALNLILYAMVAKKVQELSKSMMLTHDIEIKRLFWYPAVIFLAYLTSLLDNLIEIYLASAAETVAFTSLHILLTHSVGFTNALVYGLQRKKYYDVYGPPQHDLESKKIALTSFRKDGKTELDYSNNSGIFATKRSSCEGDLIQARATFTNSF